MHGPGDPAIDEEGLPGDVARKIEARKRIGPAISDEDAAAPRGICFPSASHCGSLSIVFSRGVRT